MLTNRILFLVTMLCISNVFAQTSATDVISRPAETNALGSPSLTFTNPSGGSFSVADLENNLANLNATIEQTLPLLAAFNTNSSSTAPSGTLGGVLSKVLTGEGNQNANPSESPSKGSKVTSNLVGILRGILTTTNTSGVQVSANTAAQLQMLQQQLESSRTILAALNFTNSAGGLTYRTNSNGILTPTGR
jgi:hypothetical protein